MRLELVLVTPTVENLPYLPSASSSGRGLFSTSRVASSLVDILTLQKCTVVEMSTLKDLTVDPPYNFGGWCTVLDSLWKTLGKDGVSQLEAFFPHKNWINMDDNIVCTTYVYRLEIRSVEKLLCCCRCVFSSTMYYSREYVLANDKKNRFGIRVALCLVVQRISV